MHLKCQCLPNHITIKLIIRGIQKKSKLTNHAIFLTSESNNGVYWLHLSNDGMFMFFEKYEELTKLVIQNGWSKYTDSLINYLFTNEEKFFDIALRNPNELKVCNALGETPFLHFLNKENSSDTIVIKNMLLVSLLVADDYIHNGYRNYWNMHHPGNRNTYDEHRIDDMTFERSLKFLYKKRDLTERNILFLKSLDDHFINEITTYMQQNNN